MKKPLLFFTQSFLTAFFMTAFGMTTFYINAQDGCELEGLTYAGSYNGSDYYLSDSGFDAADASAAAASYGGHLATIADAGENTFVATIVAPGTTAWIGFNDVASEGNFVWETGEPVTYTNWFAGEPNNCCGGEHWTVINWGFGEWNDLFSGFVPGQPIYILPMVVEFDNVDDDCDGVTNCNDACPGGDDNGPCTGEGWPLDVPENWLCSNNNNSEKYMVCHDGNTICVSSNAVATHLAHGDFLGPCTGCDSDGFTIPDVHGIDATERPIEFAVYPNPSYGDFRISLDRSGPASVQIFDQSGQIVKSWDIMQADDLGFQLQAVGMYYVRLTTDHQTITHKITVVE